MTATERIAEASEGVEYVTGEIARWIEDTAERGRAGAHLTRLDTLHDILTRTLEAIAGTMTPEAVEPLDLTGAYTLARDTDKRTLFCRRLFRWYALRFDQRAEERLDDCLAGADEVVWSVWERTFAAAKAPRRAAPLCFVDNDPVPWASLHSALPAEARPPALDGFFAGRIRELPVPVVGLPPVVVRRPWWLIIAIHETGHHVQHALADGVPAALAAAAKRAGADGAEQGQWSDWASELFADAFAAAFGGASAAWAVAELEQVSGDPFAARDTYPPAEARLRIARALVTETGAADPGFTLVGDEPPANPKSRELLERVPAIAVALLDHPLGKTTLRALAGKGPALAQAQARWAAELSAGDAQPSNTLRAAAECVGGAVRAWRDSDRSDPGPLRKSVLNVLRECGPDGTRAAGPDESPAAAQALIDALLAEGTEL